MLLNLTDMLDCAIPDAKHRKLKGRARFSIDVVNRLTSRKSRNRLSLSGDDDEDGGTIFLVNSSLALQREHIGAVVHIRHDPDKKTPHLRDRATLVLQKLVLLLFIHRLDSRSSLFLSSCPSTT